MNSINLAPTANTPSINFDAGKGLLEIKGRSTPEVYASFYRPLIEWVVEYVKNPHQITNVVIELDYLNSGSQTVVYDIFVKLNNIYKNGCEVLITWYYEKDDEFILETAEEFRDMLDMPFEIIEVEEFE